MLVKYAHCMCLEYSVNIYMLIHIIHFHFPTNYVKLADTDRLISRVTSFNTRALYSLL